MSRKERRIEAGRGDTPGVSANDEAAPAPADGADMPGAAGGGSADPATTAGTDTTATGSAGPGAAGGAGPADGHSRPDLESEFPAPRTSEPSQTSNSDDGATSVPVPVPVPGPDGTAVPDGVVTPLAAGDPGDVEADDATRSDRILLASEFRVSPAPGDAAAVSAAGGPATDGPATGVPATTVVESVPVVTAPKTAPAPHPPGEPGKPRSRRAKYLRRTAYVLAALILIPVAAFIVVYLMTPIPSTAQPMAKAEPSKLYFSNGKSVILTKGMNRQPVDLSKVPKPVRDAVISAENRSFYSDPGVSFKGTVRAVWATVRGGGISQGGSTITQQMVRNYYSGLSQQRTASRKLKEVMIALKVGREKNKDWILQQYLNTIYFGRDAYGIQAAAQAYYNTDVQDLTPSEGAYLAAAIQVPGYAADPSSPAARAYLVNRWTYVLGGEVQMGMLTPQQEAAMRFPAPPKWKQKSVFSGVKGYMYMLVRQELLRMGYTDNQINMGGLKIRTTFDKNLMDAAKQAVDDNLPSGTPAKVNVGLVSVDPANGAINAFYGGDNYLDQEFNSAFDAKVQAGSGFKPYVLAAALSRGMSLDDYVDGSSPQTFSGSSIHNNNDESFGMVNLVTATAQSINTAYVNIGKKVGNDKVIALAEKMGIPAAQLEPHKDAATLPLGVADLSVEQQAAAYAAFASEGVYHAPHVLVSVTDRNGHTRKVPAPGTRVFSTKVARDATYAMQKVVDDGTGQNAALPDRNAAGKTGTTTDGRQIWFNGFIPQLATSVGIYRLDDKPLNIPGYSAYGGQLPAKIWHAYVTDADKDIPVKSFGAPSVYAGDGVPQVPQPQVPQPTGGQPGPVTPPAHVPPPGLRTGPPPGPPTRQPPTGPPPAGPPVSGGPAG